MNLFPASRGQKFIFKWLNSPTCQCVWCIRATGSKTHSGPAWKPLWLVYVFVVTKDLTERMHASLTNMTVRRVISPSIHNLYFSQAYGHTLSAEDPPVLILWENVPPQRPPEEPPADPWPQQRGLQVWGMWEALQHQAGIQAPCGHALRHGGGSHL